MQWTGCHGEKRHGGDRSCGGRRNGQGVMVRRDKEVTEVVEENIMDRVTWQMRIQQILSIKKYGEYLNISEVIDGSNGERTRN